MRAMKPDKVTRSGEVRIADSSRFKVSKTVAAALVNLKPGGLRELHWHPNADEWNYFIAGTGRMTVFIGGSKARTIDMRAGDVGYIDQSVPPSADGSQRPSAATGVRRAGEGRTSTP
jgi:oxalate decarboxylase